MAKISFYLDMRRRRKDGTGLLKISISSKSKIKYVSLDINLRPEDWDGERVKTSHPNHKRLNNIISHRKLEAEDVEFDVNRNKTQDEDLEVIREAVYARMYPEKVAKPKDRCLIWEGFEAFIAMKTKVRTKGVYRHTLSRLRSYRPDFDRLRYEDINRSWLTKFDAYLALTSPSANARAVHLRNLRAIFNYAIDEELTTNYPFRKFRIKTTETAKRSLTLQKLRDLFDYPCTEAQKKHVDFFKLSFMLIGMNAVDLLLAQHSAVQDGRLVYFRSKTSKCYSIKLEPEVFELLEKYKGENFLIEPCDHCMNYENYLRQVNETLQDLGKVMKKQPDGTMKKISCAFPGLTTYWARHTWATIASELDIPDATISLALGHAGENKTTEIYILRNQKKIDNANRKVIDWALYGKR